MPEYFILERPQDPQCRPARVSQDRSRRGDAPAQEGCLFTERSRSGGLDQKGEVTGIARNALYRLTRT